MAKSRRSYRRKTRRTTRKSHSRKGSRKGSRKSKKSKKSKRRYSRAKKAPCGLFKKPVCGVTDPSCGWTRRGCVSRWGARKGLVTYGAAAALAGL